MNKYKKEVDLVNSIGKSYNTETDPQKKKILKDLHYIGILKLRKIITEDVEQLNKQYSQKILQQSQQSTNSTSSIDQDSSA